MASRTQRRQKHKLVHVPRTGRAISPRFKMTLDDEQEIYTCSCSDGWLTITRDDPTTAFETHVRKANGMAPDLSPPVGELLKVRV